MSVLLSTCEIAGWLMFLYLGGASVFEMLGNRRVRATALMAGAIGWVVLMFLALRLGQVGGVALVGPLAFIAASAWLARRIRASLGKPDMDWR